MSAMVLASSHLSMRRLRAMARQPAFIAVTLVQPVIWLLLFGQLFKRVVEIPGFTGDSYITYLTPGVVVMTALFSSGWSGMSLIVEMQRGVLNRFLVTPAPRAALTVGNVIYQGVLVLIQSAIIVALGLALGARFHGGPLALLAFAVAIVLLTAAFTAFSDAIALVARTEESVIALSTFLVLPLSFLSSAFMPQTLLPGWMQVVARFNPVNWTVEVGRETLSAGTDWTLIATRLGLLLLLAVVCTGLATRAFRAYRRSI
ncbi:MAG TPA: ABC transporter permease [Nitrolancea sp.]|nr:ABC transporter permease [Nitrolancea sp.]